jgi:hypothetical protein
MQLLDLDLKGALALGAPLLEPMLPGVPRNDEAASGIRAVARGSAPA